MILVNPCLVIADYEERKKGSAIGNVGSISPNPLLTMADRRTTNLTPLCPVNQTNEKTNHTNKTTNPTNLVMFSTNLILPN